ncbi:MAG: hypothetical protein M3430_17790 [Acidobacteriota bacterium]|nr:hypothetical protein [Acidobacteriota bacterium]
MTHEQFERIDVSERTAEFFIHEHRTRAEAEIKRLEADKSTDYMREADALRRHTERLERDLRAKREERARARHKCGVTWDDIGCDLLLVDEFQTFKGLDVPCRLSGVAGLASTVSERASDMQVKLDQVRRAGGRIAALTGTPITNSLTEAFVLQCFLQPEALEAAGLSRLDAWLANFGEITPATELAPEGSGLPPAHAAAPLPELARSLGDARRGHGRSHGRGRGTRGRTLSRGRLGDQRRRRSVRRPQTHHARHRGGSRKDSSGRESTHRRCSDE